MSRLNKNKWMVIILVGMFLVTLSLVAQAETDDILSFYQKRAGDVFDGRNPIISGVNFSFEAKSYRKIYDKNENQQIVDSILAHYFYSFGTVDSVLMILPPKKTFDSLDINYPNLFKGDYLFNFFPNDTGGKEISIGYDSKEFNPTIPVGLAIIDRDKFSLIRLYMHYMNEKKIDRSSKAFRFIEHEGFIFPDSVWEIKSKSGIFSTEYFRIETRISNIKIYR